MLLDWMRRHETRNGIGLALATQANYIEWLGNLLRFAGNPVIDQMRSLRYVRFPLKVSTEVKALPMSTIEEIRLRLETMIGWDGSVARFMIAMYSYSGLRRSELRLARIQDLDVESWRIHVAHPKGEGRWASPGTAPILQPARTAVLKYLAEMKQYLAANGIDYSDALVPHISRTGSCGYWTDAMWSWI